MEIREHVLGLVKEEILEPERPIVDPHHHFFDLIEGFPNYDLADLWRDSSAQNIEQTVFVQCGEHYRTSGPEALAPVGETEWVAGLAAESAKGGPGKAEVRGIVGAANLCLGAEVEEVLQAHLEASSLFRGIRDVAAWDEGEGIHQAASTGNAEMYADARFRDGFARLAPFGLSFDAYHYHTQTNSLMALAESSPETTIIVDHLSTPLGIGPYAGKRDEIFERWSKDMRDLARCENVLIKLGGLAMPWNGFGWDEADRPPTSDDVVAAHGRYIEHAIGAFGPSRCMFESNFPVDKLSLSYDILWNAFKKIAAAYSEDEKEALFRGTASRAYRLDLS